MKQRVVQATSKHSIIHVIAREFGVSVEFLDRRWWEFRPQMRISIPWKTLFELSEIQRTIRAEVRHRGYSERYVHVRISGDED